MMFRDFTMMPSWTTISAIARKGGGAPVWLGGLRSCGFAALSLGPFGLAALTAHPPNWIQTSLTPRRRVKPAGLIESCTQGANRPGPSLATKLRVRQSWSVMWGVRIEVSNTKSLLGCRSPSRRGSKKPKFQKISYNFLPKFNSVNVVPQPRKSAILKPYVNSDT